MLVRISVDFNSMMRDEQERVQISSYRHQNIENLKAGMLVLLEDGDMEVVATLEFDEEHKVWFGKPNWLTRRDLIDVSTANQ